ncbi:MAG: Holliday junction resolvase RuvX [Coriobacteriia bacterium]|nr:Holliday junction resolvase RuvX [Coriobacteriia bacterium]
MRVLGLDIGEKRIGVAISDPSGRVAMPLVVLDAKAVLRDGGELVHLIADYEVESVLIGLPLSLDGSENRQAEEVRRAGRRLARFLPVPLVYFDERFSSAEARRAMSTAGLSDQEQRGRVDMVAASLFLQAYLDRLACSGKSGELQNG